MTSVSLQPFAAHRTVFSAAYLLIAAQPWCRFDSPFFVLPHFVARRIDPWYPQPVAPVQNWMDSNPVAVGMMLSWVVWRYAFVSNSRAIKYLNHGRATIHTHFISHWLFLLTIANHYYSLPYYPSLAIVHHYQSSFAIIHRYQALSTIRSHVLCPFISISAWVVKGCVRWMWSDCVELASCGDQCWIIAVIVPVFTTTMVYSCDCVCVVCANIICYGCSPPSWSHHRCSQWSWGIIIYHCHCY